MKNIRNMIVALGALLLATGMGNAQKPADGQVIFDAMRQEMSREMDGLRLPDYTTPYFISYMVKDTEFAAVTATLGAVVSERNVPRERFMGAAIYTGDYQTNNDGGYQVAYNFGRTVIDDDPAQLRRDLWSMSDAIYKNAASAYQNKMATLRRQEIAEPLPDMLRTEPVTIVDDSATGLDADMDELRAAATELSEIFLEFPTLYNSSVNISAMQNVTYVVNSEGTTIEQPITLYALNAQATIDMPEGTEASNSMFEFLPASRDGFATEEMRRKVRDFAANLAALPDAPTVKEYYYGPVLFEGSAVMGIMSNTLLSPSTLIGYRKPVDVQTAATTLSNRVGKKVIDTRFTVKNLTDLREYDGKPLIGAYGVDVEGVVPPASTTLIEKGLFRRTLNSRIPTDISSQSTGSLRFGTSAGQGAISIAPGVLHISAEQTEKMDKLRKKLIKGAAEEGNEYAYIVRSMGRNAEIFLLDLKTGKETRVRNANVSAVTLNKLRKLLGVSDKEQVLNTQINSSIPATIICPTAILVEDIEIVPMETQKEQLMYTVNPLER